MQERVRRIRALATGGSVKPAVLATGETLVAGVGAGQRLLPCYGSGHSIPAAGQLTARPARRPFLVTSPKDRSGLRLHEISRLCWLFLALPGLLEKAKSAEEEALSCRPCKRKKQSVISAARSLRLAAHLPIIDTPASRPDGISTLLLDREEDASEHTEHTEPPGGRGCKDL
ncbi:hypothetical protein TESG_08278 [Trichophyton tonsurans CBS 112818]|uniref:Uncharacterized protein n=1 Tax=Trichophyton tonsurans (strain CBS 112818) TaxID=647933 RepID=F2RQ07_TRIT1|nr:hypothetical protein TESG_08278 [Trichophyton tonsurans CBS 112818]